ncbi:tetratricopeptide repeat protein [bacterium]|jgi:tetratricopeptide (TPR) repeat protein|nr:tetratricopeptide repeat protein [bacterium]
MENVSTPRRGFFQQGFVLVLPLFALSFSLVLAPVSSYSAEGLGKQYLQDSLKLYKKGQYYSSARYAFAAVQEDSSLKSEAYSRIALGLIQAGLPNAASYFFLRTLQVGDPSAVQSVLTQTQHLLDILGPDLLRKYLVRHTKYNDYNLENRSAYLYSLAKDALLNNDPTRSVQYIDGMTKGSLSYPFALLLRGSAHSILGKYDESIQDFRECLSRISRVKQRDLRDDLRDRCTAGQARTLYEMEKFEEAEQVYDQIPKGSYVWTDILFEQAWNGFAREEFNRSLGKLVSYKSPALSFVFNPEVDVLRAQSFLALCLYSDANQVINEFNSRYSKVGEEVKTFVERNSKDLANFYDFGKSALKARLSTKNQMYQMANRFVRSPYFQNLVRTEADLRHERALVSKLDQSIRGEGKGFLGFLDEVFDWRRHTLELLGGAFVKNSLIDYHADIIESFEKMAFIKLEMLKLAKEKLLTQPTLETAERQRGNRIPERKDYQYQWTFNGEFWDDELGDYVFGLESECTN